VVRPYALTGGRTRPSGESFDLVSMVVAIRGSRADPLGLEPEHLVVLHRCRLPISVADLAADLDLPLGVVRILIADLREGGLVAVHHPVPMRLTDPRLLREVADGLRKL
jgi:DNA-binding transcriptional ArsR family regulator